MSYIIAFDQGTTSTRAILFDEKGGVVAVSQKELKQHYPQSGWVEHDPMQLFNDQQQTFEAVIAKANVPLKAIKAIGITNQRETTLAQSLTNIFGSFIKPANRIVNGFSCILIPNDRGFSLIGNSYSFYSLKRNICFCNNSFKSLLLIIK